MANNKDFKVKNGIQPTVYHEAVGTVVSSVEGYDLSVAAYDNKSFSVATEELNPYGIAFKSDGTKMYVAGNSGDDVSQYSLSTAWDVSTASFDSVTFALGTPGTLAPYGLFFKSDGTKMYVPFSSIADVREYDLSTAWDLSTASYNSVFLDMSSEMTGAGSIYIKSDGLTLFALDYIADVVYKYTLTTAWDLSTASYSSDSVSVASTGEALSYGLWFNDDGTKFIVAGDTNDKAYEFIMTTAWDITTASYSGTSFDLTTAGSTTAPTGIAFKPDGTKMYSAMRGDDTIYQYSTSYNSNTLDLSTGSVFEISPTSDIQIGLSNPAASGTVSAATLLLDGGGSPDNNISNISYANQSFAFSEDTVVQDITFKPDGTKLYMVGQGTDYVYQYTLSTAWDVSTASYDSVSFSIGTQDTLPSDIAFKTDGTKMYLLGNSSNSVHQYSLSTAWDISTASYDSVSVTSTDTIPGGFVFKPDGTKMYIVGSSGDLIYQYTLSTAWDLSTASYDSVSLSIALQEGNAGGLAVNAEGTKFLVVGYTNDTIYQYGLTTAWDLSTGSYDSVSYAPTETTDPMGLYWYNGERLFVSSQSSPYTLAAYNTATPATITYDTTLEFAGGTAPTSPAIGETDVITISTRDGGTTYQAVQAIDGAK